MKPRTITAKQEDVLRVLAPANLCRELDAEREVSRKLAEALAPFAESKDMDEIPWKFILAARAALAQYTGEGTSTEEGL